MQNSVSHKISLEEAAPAASTTLAKLRWMEKAASALHEKLPLPNTVWTLFTGTPPLPLQQPLALCQQATII